MSQYGAYGYAKHGKDYRFILGHYYTGTTIGTLGGPRVVRVLLDIAGGDVGFSGATSACGQRARPRRALRGAPGRRRGSSCAAPAASRWPTAARKLRAAGDGHDHDRRHRHLPRRARGGADRQRRRLAQRDQRGRRRPVRQGRDRRTSRRPPGRRRRCEAQAVAARSFALTVQVGGNGFDLYDDTRSQVYEGLDSETARTNAAADATRGQVVIYGGKIAETYFSACSGGHTESVQNVFFGPPIPYLVGVPDPYDYYCPLHTWTLQFIGPEISAKLGGYLDGQLKQVVVTKRGASPRIVWARLYGTGGVTKIRGDQLAAALGGYDRWMTFRKVDASRPQRPAQPAAVWPARSRRDRPVARRPRGGRCRGGPRPRSEGSRCHAAARTWSIVIGGRHAWPIAGQVGVEAVAGDIARVAVAEVEQIGAVRRGRALR